MPMQLQIVHGQEHKRFMIPKKIENKQLATAIMNSMKTTYKLQRERLKAISSLFILKIQMYLQP